MPFEPTSEDALAEFVRSTETPIAVHGGGTRGVALKGVPITTKKLTGITLYDPGTLTMVARAGTPLVEIEQALAREGQMLPFEPYDLSRFTTSKSASTIGGVFATNASGPRRIRVGAARDFLLGVRFVDGSGKVVKNGGQVMKNVTGYDLVKLLAGSYGTLGVLTEVSFKVLPKPEISKTLQILGLRATEALAAMSTALQTPFEVSGAMYLKSSVSHPSKTFIRVEGFEFSVKRRIAEFEKLLSYLGQIDICGPEPWDKARKLQLFSAQCTELWKVGIRPTKALQYLDALENLGGFEYAVDWAGSRIWIASKLTDGETLADASLAQTHSALQLISKNIGGHTTLMSASKAPKTSRFQPLSPAVLLITERLKGKFDPGGKLNVNL